MEIRRLLQVLLLTAFAIAGSAAHAETYPDKPIRIIVPLAAGGPTDTLARSIAQQLSDKWGQSVIVDNRPGANTNIGTAQAAKAAADGYTLLLTVNNLTINPSVYPQLPFDAAKDFAPISMFATSPLVLVVNPRLPVHSVKDLIALAKSRPGKLHFGSPGNGSPPHLAGDLFDVLAGVKMVHVPYKGITGAVTDLVGDQIDLMFPGSPIALPLAKAGKLRALATTGGKRTDAAPDLPTVAEAGIPDFEFSLWYGLLAPAGTPQAVVRKLHDAVSQVVGNPTVLQQWAKLGVEPAQTTPDQFAAFLKVDAAKWQKVVRESRATID